MIFVDHSPNSPEKSSGALSDPSSFRPISIVPCLAKIVERVVHKQLFAYFSVNHLFSDSQHGFRQGHSTETALINVTDHVFRAMDAGEIGLLVLLDVSKCFDVVSHDRLIEKLALYGVHTDWFVSYFRDHYQQVRLNTRDSGPLLSSKQPNPIGVYQGTALGPLMFTIFANDLCLHSDSGVVITQYADDTQVLVTGRKADLDQLVHRMESALNDLFGWFCQNLMKVNADKTKLLVVGTRQMLRGLPRVTLHVGDASIVESDTVRNLGVTLDRYLSFEPHIEDIVHRCNGLLIGLYHAKHRLPSDVLPVVIDGLVLSVIRYCVPVYGSASKQLMHRIQKVLHFCARVLSGRRKYDHISDVLSQLGWLSSDSLCVYRSICLLRQALITGEPVAIAQSIVTTSQVHDRSTRARDEQMLRLPPIRTETGRRQFIYRATAAYNALPAAMRHGTKRMLKQHLTSLQGR